MLFSLIQVQFNLIRVNEILFCSIWFHLSRSRNQIFLWKWSIPGVRHLFSLTHPTTFALLSGTTWKAWTQQRSLRVSWLDMTNEWGLTTQVDIFRSVWQITTIFWNKVLVLERAGNLARARAIRQNQSQKLFTKYVSLQTSYLAPQPRNPSNLIHILMIRTER